MATSLTRPFVAHEHRLADCIRGGSRRFLPGTSFHRVSLVGMIGAWPDISAPLW